MFNNLLTRTREANASSVQNKANREVDELKLDTMSAYLITRYGYKESAVKDILRGSLNGKFNINSQFDRSSLINTLLDVITLELVNKYNNIFIDLTNQLTTPLVVLVDLSQIVINTTVELQGFIKESEKAAVVNFNEEARYVRTNFKD